MSYVPASSQSDLWAVLGGVLVVAAAVVAWVVRGDRRAAEDSDPEDHAAADGTPDPTPGEPPPWNGASAV